MLKQQRQHALTSGLQSSRPPESTQHERDPESPVGTVAANSSCSTPIPQKNEKEKKKTTAINTSSALGIPLGGGASVKDQ